MALRRSRCISASISTRILLPAQIFFYVGGVVSAVLLSHRLFLFPAFGPLIYNVFIIAGGVVAGRQMGIASLAFGALAGSIAGPFLINAIGAAKIGTGYRPSFDVKNPAFREWVRLSIPLMLGVSLVTADDWILRYFASSGIGDIARLNYAKRLFAVPIAILGQATGQASLPFFSRLFGEKKFEEFAATVNASVYRITAASLLMTGWMMAIAASANRSGLSARAFHFCRFRIHRDLFFLVLAFAGFVVEPGALCARVLCLGQHADSDDCHYRDYARIDLPMYSLLFRSCRLRDWRSLPTSASPPMPSRSRAAAYSWHGAVGGMNWKELSKAALVGAVSGGLSYEVMRTLRSMAAVAPICRAGAGLVNLGGSGCGGIVDVALGVAGRSAAERNQRVPSVAESQAAETGCHGDSNRDTTGSSCAGAGYLSGLVN